MIKIFSNPEMTPNELDLTDQFQSLIEIILTKLILRGLYDGDWVFPMITSDLSLIMEWPREGNFEQALERLLDLLGRDTALKELDLTNTDHNVENDDPDIPTDYLIKILRKLKDNQTLEVVKLPWEGKYFLPAEEEKLVFQALTQLLINNHTLRVIEVLSDDEQVFPYSPELEENGTIRS